MLNKNEYVKLNNYKFGLSVMTKKRVVQKIDNHAGEPNCDDYILATINDWSRASVEGLFQIIFQRGSNEPKYFEGGSVSATGEIEVRIKSINKFLQKFISNKKTRDFILQKANQSGFFAFPGDVEFECLKAGICLVVPQNDKHKRFVFTVNNNGIINVQAIYEYKSISVVGEIKRGNNGKARPSLAVQKFKDKKCLRIITNFVLKENNLNKIYISDISFIFQNVDLINNQRLRIFLQGFFNTAKDATRLQSHFKFNKNRKKPSKKINRYKGLQQTVMSKSSNCLLGKLWYCFWHEVISSLDKKVSDKQHFFIRSWMGSQ